MSIPVPAVTRTRAAPVRRPRAVPGLIVGAWAALFVNVLGWGGGDAELIPIPHTVGQLIAQASLGLALTLALLANRNLVIRPQGLLVLLLLLAVVTVMVSVHGEYLRGSTYRAFRYVGFVGVLWLLTPWFGRRDLMMLRCHLAVMRGVLATVILGAAVSPGRALSFQGRLSGIVWPIPPTQVAHYAAVLLGITMLLWLQRIVENRTLILTVLLATPILLATHTRTALLACVLGLMVSVASLYLNSARVRRTTSMALACAVAGAVLFSTTVTTWLLRGQSTQDASQLTGRTKVWAQIEALQRDHLHTLFGNGITNNSFNGLPIDSSWMSTYLDDGWFGIAVQATLLLLLLFLALTRRTGARRAIALFLITYCAVASVTETGLGAPSPYLLDLTVAAAVLAPEAGRRR